MEISITQLEDTFIVEVDGNVIPNVTNYKLISSAHGGTELELKISTIDSIKEFVSSAKTAKLRQ